MLTKKILKNSEKEVLIKWEGTGIDSFSVKSLCCPGQIMTDIYMPCVSITNIISSTGPGGFSVSRNDEITVIAYNNYKFSEYAVSEVSFAENPNYDITVDLSGGILILKLVKIQGFSEIDFYRPTFISYTVIPSAFTVDEGGTVTFDVTCYNIYSHLI
jgi:hypothetical protein